MNVSEEYPAGLFKPADDASVAASAQSDRLQDAAAASRPSGPDEELPIVKIIAARRGWGLVNWAELSQYRDLFRFLIWREIKVRYSQSAIGIGWAII